MENEMEIKAMKITDYDEVHALWRDCDGISLHADVDSKLWVGMYLTRNPGLSFIVIVNGKIVGAVLCGHDGRRGYLHHLAVHKDHRNAGIGTALIEKATQQLREKGIRKCHTFCFCDNKEGLTFWQNKGFAEHKDLKIVSREIIL